MKIRKWATFAACGSEAADVVVSIEGRQQDVEEPQAEQKHGWDVARNSRSAQFTFAENRQTSASQKQKDGQHGRYRENCDGKAQRACLHYERFSLQVKHTRKGHFLSVQCCHLSNESVNGIWSDEMIWWNENDETTVHLGRVVDASDEPGQSETQKDVDGITSGDVTDGVVCVFLRSGRCPAGEHIG